jgi:hypothetical protein
MAQHRADVVVQCASLNGFTTAVVVIVVVVVAAAEMVAVIFTTGALVSNMFFLKKKEMCLEFIAQCRADFAVEPVWHIVY